MASWVPPDRYEGTLKLPEAPAPKPAPARTSEEPSAIERLYEREPKLTRNLLEQLRAAMAYAAMSRPCRVDPMLARIIASHFVAVIILNNDQTVTEAAPMHYKTACGAPMLTINAPEHPRLGLGRIEPT
jgi:hypothetical protein